MSNDWLCPHCGRDEHDAIHTMADEIEVDVTCQSVYFTFLDDDGGYIFPGMAFDHDEFERIIDHYRASTEVDDE